MNNEIFSFIPEEIDCNKRLDVFLNQRIPDKSRSSLQMLIKNGDVLVNNVAQDKNYKIRIKDIIELTIPNPQELETLPMDIPIEIVYEDSDLLVCNKPKGMVVHPAPGHLDDTLVNALLFHCKGSLSGINGVIRPGIVHRIDKDTSGLLIVAKNDEAHIKLAEQIKVHSFLREYEAVVYGNIKQDTGTISLPIARNKIQRKKMCVSTDMSLAKKAITHFEVIERYQGFTHVRLKLETGRTHQIRVHMSAMGTPIAGDDVYGPKSVITSLKGQCLHAKTIGFVHPKNGENLYFTSDLPTYFKRFLSTLKTNY